MGFMSSLLGGTKTPSYLTDLNQAHAKYQQAQLAANQGNWANAQKAVGMGASSDIGYNTASGSLLNNNPYINQMAGNTAQQIQNSYNTSKIPQAMSSFAQSGRFGSGLMQKNLGNMQSQMNQDIGNASNNLFFSNYGAERNHMENAQNRLGQQYDPLNRAAQYGNILNQGQANVNTNMGVDYNSGLMGLLGAGAGIAGGLATAYSGFSGNGAKGTPSDHRLKENLEHLDTVDGVNIYRFDYIDGAKNQVGVMAQEIKDRLPKVVGERNGYLTVNYSGLPESVQARINELK